jgi:uncharacterized membrane protein
MTEPEKLEIKEIEQIKQAEQELKNTAGKNNEFSDANKKAESLSLKDITQIVYLCQVLSCFFGISTIVGVIINYCKRDAVKGTWLESHFTWQLRTFWISLAVSIIGWIFIFVLFGFLILAVNLVWIIYRVVKGWLLLSENKPIPDSTALV